MTVKLLAEQHLEFLSLKGGYTGWAESMLFKMPQCWKSHVTAHLLINRILAITSQQALTCTARWKRKMHRCRFHCADK